MNRKFCDRCGKEINTNPMMKWIQCQNPLFEIRQLYPQGIMPIDLCEDCSKKFVEWVKEYKNGNDD
jgi:DNA-directed RNA polymerase subunit RPC12/RpoP